MRTWGRFRMVLHRESWLIFQANTCNSIVVEVHMGDFNYITFLHILSADHEAVVLGGDFTLPCLKVFDGVVKASMTVVHFISRNTTRLGKDLMSQTDPKHRFVGVQYILSGLNGITHDRRITGTIGKEITIRIPSLHFG